MDYSPARQRVRRFWRLAVVLVTLAGCSPQSHPTGSAVDKSTTGGWHVDTSLASFRFGQERGRWFLTRPGDPTESAAAWGQACTRVGGTFYATADRLFTERGYRIFLPGPGWCQLPANNMLLFVGGWIEPENLSRPQNLIAAASAHTFTVEMTVKSSDPGASVPSPLSFGNALLGVALYKISQMAPSADMYRIVRQEVRHDPARENCALIDLVVDFTSPKPIGQLTEFRSSQRALVCVRPGSSVAVSIDEIFFLKDPGVDARGRVVRDQIGRIFDSVVPNAN